MTEIAAFDPGVMTGIAAFDGKEFRSFQIEPRLYPHPHEALFDTLSGMQPETIIYEAFHFRQNMKGVVFTGVEYIGVIELFAQLNYIPVIVITPSDGKGFWDDRKLKAIGVHNPGHIHANDAMRLILRHKMKDGLWMGPILQQLKSL